MPEMIVVKDGERYFAATDMVGFVCMRCKYTVVIATDTSLPFYTRPSLICKCGNGGEMFSLGIVKAGTEIIGGKL